MEAGESPHKSTATLPLPSQTELPLSPYERASEVLKQGLMARFGSIVGAYEWFDLNTGGYINLSEFEKCLLAGGVSTPLLVRELFSALDRSGSGRFSLSEFLSEAVKKLHPAPLPEPVRQPDNSSPELPKHELKRFSDPTSLPAGRRALRTASILAFRNGRYDDAIVSALQALGITAPTPRWVASLSRHPDNLVELLLLARAFSVTKQLQKGEPFVRLIESIMSDMEGSVVAPHVEATLLCSLGGLFDEYEKIEFSEKFFHQYVTMTRSVFGPTSLVYGDAVTIVSGFYLKHKQLEVALALAKQALEIRSENLAAPHARLADACANLGIVLRHSGQLKEAVTAFKESAEQRVKLFGPNSIPAADSFFSIGSVQVELLEMPSAAAEDDSATDSLGQAQEAEKYLSGAHSVRLKLLGPAHADSLAAAELLRRLAAVRKPPVARKLTAKHESAFAALAAADEAPRPPRAEEEKVPVLRLASTFLAAPEEPRYESPKARPSEPDSAAAPNPMTDREVSGSTLNLLETLQAASVGQPIGAADQSAPEEGSGMASDEAESEDGEAEEDESVDTSRRASDDTDEGERQSVTGIPTRSMFATVRRASALQIGDSEVLANPNATIWQNDGGVDPPTLELPDSPFKQAQTLLGTQYFITDLQSLHSALLGSTDFDIANALPEEGPDWVRIAMQAVYAREVLRQDSASDPLTAHMKTALAAIAGKESELKLVFTLLNSIFAAIDSDRNRAGKPIRLTVDDFSDFINSRTQNVALAEYFRDAFMRTNPGVLEDVIACLANLDQIVDFSVSEFATRTTVRRQSMQYIRDSLRNVPDPVGDTETSPEAKMVLEVIARKPEIARTYETLDKRHRLVSNGVRVLGELFNLSDPVTYADLAVDCLHELWVLLEAPPESPTSE